MTFGSRATPRSSAPVEPAESWEAPRVAGAKPDRNGSGFIKGSLTVSGALAFLRENGRRICVRWRSPCSPSVSLV